VQLTKEVDEPRHDPKGERIRAYRAVQLGQLPQMGCHAMRWPFSGRQKAPPPPPPLEPIRIYADEAVLDGSVTTNEQRMTDILQHAEEIEFLPAGADPNRPGAWIRVPTTRMLLVVPPPHVSPPERRQSRERQEVTLNSGGYRVTGIAHLRPGLERDVYLRATQPFLPLTSATVMAADGSSPVEHDVVIVNLRWAEFVDT
jgi:hypothetical protein